MPQVDIVLYLPIVIDLFILCSLFFGLGFGYLFYPFIVAIKTPYSFLCRIMQSSKLVVAVFV